MSHEVESMMYVGETPWHGLGTALDAPPDAAQAIQAAGLGWNVELQEIYTGAAQPIATHRAVVRQSDGAVLGVVGDRYRPLQNAEAFAWMDPFVQAGAATYHTAGSLKGGRRVWVLAKLTAEPLEIVPGDAVRAYLLLSTSHDGSTMVRVQYTPVRVVCNNTLTMAEHDSAAPFMAVRHTAGMVDTLAKVRECMDNARRTFAVTAEQYRYLAEHQVGGDLGRYLVDVLRDESEPVALALANGKQRAPRALPHIINLFEHGRGAELAGVRGTWWGAYNAVTEWVDHERGTSPDTRLDAAWFGEGARIKGRALAHALKLAA